MFKYIFGIFFFLSPYTVKFKRDIAKSQIKQSLPSKILTNPKIYGDDELGHNKLMDIAN